VEYRNVCLNQLLICLHVYGRQVCMYPLIFILNYH
jgi:hypothetical protein